jgi:hypothetical protein
MGNYTVKQPSKLNLKAGEWVEVLTPEEILATLDDRGCFENLPFMPEMLQYCGQKLRVYKRADKACDNIVPWGIRRMENSVHLAAIRCDGSSHGDCQAGCLLFWKEVWLRRCDETSAAPAENPSTSTTEQGIDGLTAIQDLSAATQKVSQQGEILYSCQATEMRNYTSYMKWWDPRQYVRDVCSGNLSDGLTDRSSTGHAIDLVLSILQAVRGFFLSIVRERFGVNYPAIVGRQERTPIETLNLQPGELVQVRSKEEIIETLDKNNRNRGLIFDCEMLRYCGGIYRVLRRVHHIIDEKTGKMLDMKYPCIVLEGVFCLSDYHRLCPKAIYSYWRESWLVRVSPERSPSNHSNQKLQVCQNR